VITAKTGRHFMGSTSGMQASLGTEPEGEHCQL
jgi:hypothetical protein